MKKSLLIALSLLALWWAWIWYNQNYQWFLPFTTQSVENDAQEFNADDISDFRAKKEEMEQNEVKLLAERRKLNPVQSIKWPEKGFSCDNVTQIPKIECQALADLYNSTNGSKWRNKTNWLQTNEPCEWFGVTCRDIEWSLRIVHLDLRDNLLVGTIPDSIGNLYEVISLIFYLNKLTGPIPQELWSLPNLASLDARVNNLIWGLKWIWNAKNLQYLSLSQNNIWWSIPSEIAMLPYLRFLYLEGNNFGWSIPEELWNITKLQKLWIRNNHLCGRIPESFMNLPLNEFRVSDNNLIMDWYSQVMTDRLATHLKNGFGLQKSKECNPYITDPTKLNPPVDEKNNDDGM